MRLTPGRACTAYFYRLFMGVTYTCNLLYWTDHLSHGQVDFLSILNNYLKNFNKFLTKTSVGELVGCGNWSNGWCCREDRLSPAPEGSGKICKYFINSIYNSNLTHSIVNWSYEQINFFFNLEKSWLILPTNSRLKISLTNGLRVGLM